MSKSDGDSPWGCVVFGVLAVWTGFSFILLGDIRQMKEAPSIVIFITYLPAVSIIFGIILLALRVFYAEFIKPLLPKVKRVGPPISDEALWGAITEKPKPSGDNKS